MTQEKSQPSANLAIAPKTYEIDPTGIATIGGMEVTKLAKTFGTPLYVMDNETIESIANSYTETLKENYDGETLVLMAAKANINMGICKLAESLGLGIDVVSGGELHTALEAGFPPEKIMFNGNNKSLEELSLAIDSNIDRIIADNFHELSLIHEIATAKGNKVDVILRVTPGIECHTHDYIKTGQIDSKFGFDISMLPQVFDLLTTTYKNSITLTGLHAHIGSQIFEVKPYEDLAKTLLNIYYNVKESYGITLTDLNIGGGFGIKYTEGDDPLDISSTYKRILETITSYAKQLEYPLPRLIIEPGRSLLATSGVTLYTIGSSKEVPGGKKYISVDGGMGDNIRPALYQATYSAIVGNKANSKNEDTVVVAGKFCESGDILIQQLPVPKVEPGDILLVFGTGAYNYSMSSQYNRVPRPGMVIIKDGQAHTLVERESYDSLLSHDRIPDYLTENAREAVH